MNAFTKNASLFEKIVVVLLIPILGLFYAKIFSIVLIACFGNTEGDSILLFFVNMLCGIASIILIFRYLHYTEK